MFLNLEFTPQLGFSDLKLGMTETEIKSLLGNPNTVSQKRRGRYTAAYNYYSITFSPEKIAVNIEVFFGTNVSYKGKDIFDNQDTRKQLILDDGEAKVISGTIVLLNLGLSIWEDENEDNSNKTIVAFMAGEWDRLKNKMKTYSIDQS